MKDCKNENRALAEKVEFLERTREDAELKINDFENQVKHVKVLLNQRQEREDELLGKLEELEEEANSLRSQNSSLSKVNSSFEAEKRDWEKNNLRIGKDVQALKKTLDKLQRERLEFEESFFESNQEREALNRTLGEAAKENIELKEKVDSLERALQETAVKHTERY